MAAFSITLNDPNLVFKVTLFFDAGYFTNDYIRVYLEIEIGNSAQVF